MTMQFNHILDMHHHIVSTYNSWENKTDEWQKRFMEDDIQNYAYENQN